ncbi:MAG: AAA family ATPase, partial [Bacteroidota bacterium]
KGAPEVLITDVGFGISQVLPVLVQCFYVPANSTILFEQPEIHLHPSVQAYLADVFIEAIHAHEDSKPRHTQLIIESHSEHLIRRLQRKIAEEELKLEDVAIYFVDQKKGVSTIEALEIDEFGNILNWPDNFFGDDLEDLTAMALKGIERKRKMSGNGIRN